MPLVASLICNPADPALDSTVVDGARAILPSPGPAHWLFDEVAVDIPFEGSEDAPTIARRLREARGDLPIDIVVQPRAYRRKKLLLADMDSTMIEQECIDELADFGGQKAHVAGITERAMRGEIEFEPALRERVALLKGMPVSVVDEVLAKRITPTPGGRELVATMRAHGAYTCLISGGFTLFTSAVAAMLGFQEHRANELIVRDGKLTGEVKEPILGRAAKLATLIELTESFDLDDLDTLAAGDGATDLDMIQTAGLGVACHETDRRRRGGGQGRLRRSHRVALCAGVSARRVCGGIGSMPTVLRWGPYRAFFYSNERGEPPHIHVRPEIPTRNSGCTTFRSRSMRDFPPMKSALSSAI